MTAETYNEWLIMFIDGIWSLISSNRPMMHLTTSYKKTIQQYDTEVLAELVRTNVRQLNQEQKDCVPFFNRNWEQWDGGGTEQKVKKSTWQPKQFWWNRILLSGNFRQTLPVFPRSTVAHELNACLKSLNLWRHVKALQLTTNVPVFLQTRLKCKCVFEAVIDIGIGKVAVDTFIEFLTLPTDFCQSTDSKD